MKLCIKCSLPLISNVHQCNECGASQVEQVECKQCHSLMTPQNNKCPKCGAQVTQETQCNPLRGLFDKPGCCVTTVINKDS